MNCHVCGEELKMDSGRCPVCGFAVLVQLEQNKELDKPFQQTVVRYRRERQKDHEVGFFTWNWKREGPDHFGNDRQPHPLARCGQLEDGQIHWHKEEIISSGEEPLMLSYFIRELTDPGDETGVKEKTGTIFFEGTCAGNVQVGLSMDHEAFVHFHVKDEDRVIISPPVNVLS